MQGTGMITFCALIDDLWRLDLFDCLEVAPIVSPLAAYLKGSMSSSPSSLNLAGLLSKLSIEA